MLELIRVEYFGKLTVSSGRREASPTPARTPNLHH
jgi:hypothetical protein